MHPISNEDLLFLFVHYDEQLLHVMLPSLDERLAVLAMDAAYELLTGRGVVLHDPKTGYETDVLKGAREKYYQQQKGKP